MLRPVSRKGEYETVSLVPKRGRKYTARNFDCNTYLERPRNIFIFCLTILLKESQLGLCFQ